MRKNISPSLQVYCICHPLNRAGIVSRKTAQVGSDFYYTWLIKCDDNGGGLTITLESLKNSLLFEQAHVPHSRIKNNTKAVKTSSLSIEENKVSLSPPIPMSHVTLMLISRASFPGRLYVEDALLC